MKTHQLKCSPEYFAEVWSGDKLHEVRYDDRAYQRGDVVVLHEYDRDAQCTDCLDHRHRDRARCRRYSGRWIEARVGFLHATVSGPQGRRPLDPHGHVIFTLLDRIHSDEITDDSTGPPTPDADTSAAAASPVMRLGTSSGLAGALTVHPPSVSTTAPSPLDLGSRRVPAPSSSPRLAYSSETPRTGER